MKTKNIFEEWISAVDLTKTRIVNFPSYIFVCGGPISDDHEKPLSCRDIFCSYLKKNECSFRKNVIRAEEVFKYFEHSDYQDLLCFERDIAELSILTVIFSESPGSIAELGSFSVINTIQERLLIVLHKDDAHQESFIWRGPIQFIKNLAKSNRKDDPITIYNWQKAKNENGHFNASDFSDAVDLAETIETIVRKQPKTMTFSKNQLGHIMLLVICILKIVQIATLEEVLFILKRFSIKEESKTVKQHLSLLKSLGLIILHPYRNYDFYVSAPQSDWFSWGYNQTAKIRDTHRWINRFIGFYQDNQKEKIRAYRSYLTSNGQIGD
ncbi:MAG: hypothetical protein HY911_08540 [Desulfobacterales bacterium]|nr:hypothetical protein [Desulfobacterales bacterium]